MIAEQMNDRGPIATILSVAEQCEDFAQKAAHRCLAKFVKTLDLAARPRRDAPQPTPGIDPQETFQRRAIAM